MARWILFRNSVTFGIDDAQFGRDIGFYVFRLPFLKFVVDWLFVVVVIITFVTVVAHYLNGGIRLPRRRSSGSRRRSRPTCRCCSACWPC